MMLDVRPASLIPCVFVISVAIELVLFTGKLSGKQKVESALRLTIGKFVSVCLPYLTMLLINRNDASGFGKEAAAEYIKEADEYVYEAFNISPYFAGLFILVELPLFYLWFSKDDNRKELLPKFIVLNVILAVIFVLIDFLVCRRPQIA